MVFHPHSVRSLLLLLLLLLLSLCGIIPVAHALDHILLHSFHPPILSDFWDNGMRYWSFGSGTVITDDFARLTTVATNSQGYLWNRHPNHLDSFLFNVTLRIPKLNQRRWRSDLTGAGFGIWYTADTPRHSMNKFFGSVNTFNGIGVLYDHGGRLTLIRSDGYHPVTDIKEATIGSCQAITPRGQDMCISIKYNAQTQELAVSYFSSIHIDPYYQRNPEHHNNNKKKPETVLSNEISCAVVQDIKLLPHQYFGVTAANDENSQGQHEVESFYVKPINGNTDAEEARQELKLFEHVKERREREAIVNKRRLERSRRGEGYPNSNNNGNNDESSNSGNGENNQ